MKLFTVVLVLIVPLLAAGCGGGADRDDYERSLGTIARHLDAASAASTKAGQVDPQDQDARAQHLADASRSIAAAATAAKAAEAPDDAAKAHEQLASALTDYADLYEQIASAAPDDPKLGEMYGRVQPVIDRLKKANAAVEKAGYEAAK